MRLVCVADTHLYQADLGALPAGDVFVHAGDMLRGGTLDELAEAADWLRSLPYRHKVLVAGNHEVCFEQDAAAARALLPPDVTYLQDAGCEVAGLRFWGSPWQPAYNDWAFNLPRGAALAAKWALIPPGTEVLVTHGPPAGFGDRSGIAGRQGCAELLARARVVRPALHLFGHIHADGGVFRDGGTTFVNCTTWECERGPTVLDVERGPDGLRVRIVVVPPANR